MGRLKVPRYIGTQLERHVPMSLEAYIINVEVGLRQLVQWLLKETHECEVVTSNPRANVIS